MEMTERNGSINAALATGIIGTTLSVLGGAGGLLGAHSGIAAGNQYVTKEVSDLQTKLIAAERQSAILQADLNSEKKMVEVYNGAINRINSVRDELRGEIRGVEIKVDENAAAQGVINATMSNQVGLNSSQIAQLMGMTKLVIPNSSVCPGWGAVTVQTVPSTTGTTIS